MVKDDLTKAEWNATKELKNNSNIIIKESDKRGACVIMDAEFYDKKMSEMTNHENTYKKLDNNIDIKDSQENHQPH